MNTKDTTHSITDVMRRIGWVDALGKPVEAGRVALYRYLQIDGVRELLKAEGDKNPTFPAHTVPTFAALRAAHEAKQVSPSTAAVWLRQWQDDRGMDSAYTVPAPISPSCQQAIAKPAQEMVPAVAQAIQDALTSLTSAPEDELITRDQVASILKCSPRSVRRYVRPVRRRLWSRQDVMAYILNLRRHSSNQPVISATAEGGLALRVLSAPAESHPSVSRDKPVNNYSYDDAESRHQSAGITLGEIIDAMDARTTAITGKAEWTLKQWGEAGRAVAAEKIEAKSHLEAVERLMADGTAKKVALDTVLGVLSKSSL